MASKLRKNLEEQVTCPICQEHFTDPRLLPCLHTYCNQCLAELVRTATRKGQISCPECRKIVQIDSNGVDMLKVNFQMNNLISLLASSSVEEETNKSELVCENCTGNDAASGKCVDCCKFMCDFCIKTHTRFQETQDHTVMSLDEVKKRSTPAMSQRPKCPKHKDKKMRLYCESCKELICRDCTIIDHRDHCYHFIEDVAEQHKKCLKAVLVEAVDSECELEQTKNRFEEMKLKIKTRCENLEEEIEKAINEQIEILKQKEKRLKEKVRKSASGRIKSIKKQEQDLETSLKNLKGSIQFTQAALQANDNVTILSISSEANNRLSTLIKEVRAVNKQPSKRDDFKFQVDSASIKQSIDDGMSIINERQEYEVPGRTDMDLEEMRLRMVKAAHTLEGTPFDDSSDSSD